MAANDLEFWRQRKDMSVRKPEVVTSAPLLPCNFDLIFPGRELPFFSLFILTDEQTNDMIRLEYCSLDNIIYEVDDLV